MMRRLLPGIRLELGGDTFVVPPLALGDLELLQDRIVAFQASTAPFDRESIRLAIDATHAALLRNYPEITREDVARRLDVGNMMDVMLAVLDVSGLGRAEQEKRDGAGKAQPVPGSTGDASTPTSPPAPAGPSST